MEKECWVVAAERAEKVVAEDAKIVRQGEEAKGGVAVTHPLTSASEDLGMGVVRLS